MKVTVHGQSFALACLLASAQAAAQTPAPAPAEPPPAEAPAAAPAPEAAPAPPAEPAPAPPAEPAPAAPAEAAPAPPPPPFLVAPPPPARPQPPPVRSRPELDEAPEVDDGQLGSHQKHISIGAGVRTNFIADESFDPFAENDALAQVSLHAGAVLMTSGALSFVALAGWDYGQAQSKARGATTELDLHRFWLGAETRYHVLRRFYGYGRLAPALLLSEASLRDDVAQADRDVDSLLFGADVTLGLAYELFGKNSGGSSSARGWLSLGGGYAFVTSSDLLLEVDEGGSAPIRTAALDLGELALSAPFMRVDFAVSF